MSVVAAAPPPVAPASHPKAPQSRPPPKLVSSSSSSPGVTADEGIRGSSKSSSSSSFRVAAAAAAAVVDPPSTPPPAIPPLREVSSSSFTAATVPSSPEAQRPDTTATTTVASSPTGSASSSSASSATSRALSKIQKKNKRSSPHSTTTRTTTTTADTMSTTVTSHARFVKIGSTGESVLSTAVYVRDDELGWRPAELLSSSRSGAPGSATGLLDSSDTGSFANASAAPGAVNIAGVPIGVAGVPGAEISTKAGTVSTPGRTSSSGSVGLRPRASMSTSSGRGFEDQDEDDNGDGSVGEGANRRSTVGELINDLNGKGGSVSVSARIKAFGGTKSLSTRSLGGSSGHGSRPGSRRGSLSASGSWHAGGRTENLSIAGSSFGGSSRPGSRSSSIGYGCSENEDSSRDVLANGNGVGNPPILARVILTPVVPRWKVMEKDDAVPESVGHGHAFHTPVKHSSVAAVVAEKKTAAAEEEVAGVKTTNATVRGNVVASGTIIENVPSVSPISPEAMTPTNVGGGSNALKFELTASSLELESTTKVSTKAAAISQSTDESGEKIAKRIIETEASAVVTTVDLSSYENNTLPLQDLDDIGNPIVREDMCHLAYIHEASILYNLKHRHEMSMPYTRAGVVIVSVNPLVWFEDLYTMETRRYYAENLVWRPCHKLDEIHPHVYEASALAYRGLMLEGRDQSILVSGETGAGKTETVKILMSHLATMETTRSYHRHLFEGSNDNDNGDEGNDDSDDEEVEDEDEDIIQSAFTTPTSGKKNKKRRRTTGKAARRLLQSTMKTIRNSLGYEGVVHGDAMSSIPEIGVSESPARSHVSSKTANTDNTTMTTISMRTRQVLRCLSLRTMMMAGMDNRGGRKALSDRPSFTTPGDRPSFTSPSGRPSYTSPSSLRSSSTGRSPPSSKKSPRRRRRKKRGSAKHNVSRHVAETAAAAVAAAKTDLKAEAGLDVDSDAVAGVNANAMSTPVSHKHGHVTFTAAPSPSNHTVLSNLTHDDELDDDECQEHDGSSRNAAAAVAKNSIVQKVLDANPLLESFGNAKTTRNDNSSRFSKYNRLQYHVELDHDHRNAAAPPKCTLAGSVCDTYLLEKSRVVSHESDMGERTFHIFYQLLAASEGHKGDIWEAGLDENTDESSFRYVGYTDTHEIEGISDAERWEEVVVALRNVGVHGDTFHTFMRSICAVLQLGNISFIPDEHNLHEEGSAVSSWDEADKLSDLLGIAADTLSDALTTRTVTVGGEAMKVALTPTAATDARDAFAKEIYARSFDWLVRKINDATRAELNYGKRDDVTKFSLIGLLDIFGFETFDVNRFEQLCINHANEKLQQKFTEDVFRSILAECDSEGVVHPQVTFDDNGPVLDLVEGKMGLIDLLNEECIRPRGNDAGFVNKLYAAKNGSKTNSYRSYRSSSPLFRRRGFQSVQFGVRHYPGDVVYDATNFVMKNMDTLPEGVVNCALRCSNEIIREEFKIHNDRRQKVAETNRSRSSRNLMGGTLVAHTVWTKFHSQLNNLMGELSRTQTRYVRCIVPNRRKMPGEMDLKFALGQLRCAGIVNAITLSRSFFPNKMFLTAVLDRFSFLAKLLHHRDAFSASAAHSSLQPEKKSSAVSEPAISSTRQDGQGQERAQKSLQEEVNHLLRVLLRDFETKSTGDGYANASAEATAAIESEATAHTNNDVDSVVETNAASSFPSSTAHAATGTTTTAGKGNRRDADESVSTSSSKSSSVEQPFVCGKTRVYFRAGVLEWLEAERLHAFDAMATVIQCRHRRNVAIAIFEQRKAEKEAEIEAEREAEREAAELLEATSIATSAAVASTSSSYFERDKLRKTKMARIRKKLLIVASIARKRKKTQVMGRERASF